MTRRSFAEALATGGLVADGAMGTQLYERGVLYSASFEALNLSRPELVAKVHEDYLRAGATVIETNTFGANALRLEKHNLTGKIAEINQAAVTIAREVAGDQAYVVGAIGPSGYFLGAPSRSDLDRVHTALLEQAHALTAAGVDGLLLETFRQPAEVQVALEAALRATDGALPIVVSLSVDPENRMADGQSVREMAEKLRDWGAHAIGVNCSDGPMNVLSAIDSLRDLGLPLWALPNAGLPQRVDERMVYVSTPEYFGVYARRLFKLGAAVVGGCCGTTPDHVRRIAAAARMTAASHDDDPHTHGVPFETREAPSGQLPSFTDPVPLAERSQLAAKLGKRFVVSVEVNPPIGLNPQKAIDAARTLKNAGIDVINVADGARAQARMSNLVLAARMQRDVGIETIVHVCGRDRNLLATLAHLMGAHDEGIRNLVIITGDPPKMGDFPDASAVYDLDSIGILKLASRLNHGVDPSGKPLGDTTRFLLATGAEPAALNYERELERLRLKKEAGAELVMTQPVYDPAVLERFLDDIKALELPVLVGLLPLASHRNAEFLHNEVPGMQVPLDVRERMRKAGSDGKKEGVKIAREMLAAVRHRVAGAYIMPPFERHELALEVVDGFLDTE